MRRAMFILSIIFFVSSFIWCDDNVSGLTNRNIEPENKNVIGTASGYIPVERSKTEVNKISDNRDWEPVNSIIVDSYIPAGGHLGVGVSGSDHSMELVSELGALTNEAEQAIFKAPRWLKAELENVFSQLSEFDQLRWAEIINNAEHPYIDEIAFSIAQSSVVYLSSEFAYPELFVHNAWLMYDHDLDLGYVQIIDYGDPSTDPDYYSTTRYWKTDADGNNYEVEVPQDIYYMYLVHPKNTDEIPAYIDPDVVESNANHQNNVVSPSEGVFWRDYLYNYNDPGYPKLKNYLMEKDYVWNGQNLSSETVMGVINVWVSQSMSFTSNAERPHQPVRIYKKHIGRCGEYADLRSALARTALIPCTSVLTISGDHTWNEFWDEGWIHWEDAVNNPLLYENGWGRHYGTIFEIRSNGVISPVSDIYSDGHAILNVYVLDQNNDPVDGARILLGMHNGSNIVADMVGFTGNDGKYSFIVGEDVSYYAQVTSYAGDIPGYMSLVDMAQDGMEYDLALYPGGTMPETAVTEIPVPEDDEPDYKLVVDCTVTEQISHGTIVFDDIDNTQFYDPGSEGSINFFMADLIEYYLYADNESFQGFDPHYDVGSVATEFAMPDPLMGYWYAFFDNKYRVEVPQHITGSFTLYSYNGAGGSGIISGIVTDENTGDAMSDVQVEAGMYLTVTDGSGSYSLEVFPGSYDVTFNSTEHFPGKYFGISVTNGGETDVNASLIEFPEAPANVAGEITPEGYAYITWGEAAFLEIMNNSVKSRELESYNVYVGEYGDEMNVDFWSLSGIAIVGTEYTDMIFPYLPMGVYRYAVKAVYSGGNLSPAMFTNALYNQMTVDVSVDISTNSEDSPEGAVVTLDNQESSNSIFVYDAEIDESGLVNFSDVLIGTYNLNIQLGNFNAYSEVILIEEDTDIEVQLIETIARVIDLSVIDFIFSWEPVPADRSFQYYNIYFDGVLDPTPVYENSFFFDFVDNGYHVAGVNAIFTSGESVVSEIGFEDGSSVNTDLIAYYPFNGDVNDESGNDNHGSIIGEISYPDGELNGAAALFTGMDDYVEISTIFTEAPSAFSLVWWLNPTSCFNWSQQIRSVAGWNAFNFHTTNEGYFYTGTTGGTRFNPGQLNYRTMYLEEWQQYCYTYDNGYAAFFINGEMIASKTNMAAPTAWNGMWIGCDNTNTIDGMIDEIRLWDRAVGSEEVAYLYTEDVPFWGVIEGYVLSSEGSEPVEGAVINAGMFQAVTDAAGFYTLNVAATTYTVTCYVDDYDLISISDVIVEQDETETVNFDYPFTGEDGSEIIPQGNILHGNYPNPFNPSTTISFSVAQTTSPVTLEIYNLKGQKVKKFGIRNLETGMNEITWNGSDENGNSVPSGIYFYKLKNGDFEQTKKMILMK